MPAFSLVAEQLPLLRELNDIKRLYARNLGSRSFATLVFFGATKPLHTGEALHADAWCASIICAARLGAITSNILQDIDISSEERVTIFQDSLRTHATLTGSVFESLLDACHRQDGLNIEQAKSASEWVSFLAESPRAGATCPGKPRIALEPAEMHSEHCMLVASYAYLLADIFGANREDVWLMGLCHHLHNAYLPDSGFTGEVLLEKQLHRIISSQRDRVLENFSENYRTRVNQLFKQMDDLDTPLAQAFTAADTIDRVIQMEHYERAANFKVKQALEDFNLVHEGTAQKFQQALLHSIGISYKASA